MKLAFLLAFVSIAAASRGLHAQTCRVIELVDCETVSEVDCNDYVNECQYLVLGIYLCTGDVKEGRNTREQVSDVRDAGPGELGYWFRTQTDAKYCYKQRPCFPKCEAVNIFLEEYYYRCKAGTGDWENVGDSYAIWTGNGGCMGTYGD